MTEEKVVPTEQVEAEAAEAVEKVEKVEKPEETKAEQNPLSKTEQFEIPVADVNEETEKELRKIKKTVKMHGFRPGKVPMEMVRGGYGRDCFNKALENKVEEKIKDFVKNYTGPKLVYYPYVSEVKTTEDGKNFICTMHFEVMPEITVPDCAGLELTKVETKITEDDYKAMMDRMLKLFTEFKKVERPAQKGDKVTVEYSAIFPAAPENDEKDRKGSLVLDGTQAFPEVTEGIIGMSAGEEKLIKFTIPEKGSNPALAGKEVEYTVKVEEVAEPHLPEITPEFVKKLGVENGDVEKFKESARKNFDSLVKGRVDGMNKQTVMNALIGLINFPVPAAMVEEERIRLVKDTFAQHMGKEPSDKDIEGVDRNMFLKEATNRVGLGLLLGEIINKEQFKVNEEAVRKLAEEIAQNYQDPEEVIEWYMNDKARRNELDRVTLENQVVEWVFGKAKVTDKEVSCKDLLQIPEA